VRKDKDETCAALRELAASRQEEANGWKEAACAWRELAGEQHRKARANEATLVQMRRKLSEVEAAKAVIEDQ
jgi:hypothetical protein